MRLPIKMDGSIKIEQIADSCLKVTLEPPAYIICKIQTEPIFGSDMFTFLWKIY